MKLGFYYHSNYTINSSKVVVPGYIGVFIDSLASQVDELTLFLEKQTDVDSVEEDYELQQSNIRLVSLGNRSTFYHRLFWGSAKVSIFKNHVKDLDALLIRVPSPLMPSVYFALKHTLPVFPFVVGNYLKGIWTLEQPFFRKLGIVLVNYIYQFYHYKMLNGANIFVNSKELYDDNIKRAQSVTLVKTTTLQQSDFFEREDSCQNETVRILFTGRINYQKGLRELIEAIAQLKDQYNIVLDIVGWEEKTAFNYENELVLLTNMLGISSRVFFHGKKKLGAELNGYYRQADIYAIPSYHEGFPRTIWEAMANSLPVIATNVGSIPHYLHSEENSLIIQPKSTLALKEAILRIISNPDLRKKLISNGYTIAKDVTMQKQTALLVKQLSHYLKHE